MIDNGIKYFNVDGASFRGVCWHFTAYIVITENLDNN